MKRLTNLKKILIIDFGSQFTQLIARRIRELGVFSEIISHKHLKKLDQNDIFGMILSGGPLNVYQDKKIKLNNNIFKFNCPIAAIAPNNIDAKEIKTSIVCHCSMRLTKGIYKNLMKTVSAAALGRAAKNKVTDVGEPW